MKGEGDAHLIGMFWYRNEEEFQRLQSVTEDDAKVHDSYAEWLQAAEDGFECLKDGDKGVTFVKVEVDPDEYLSWCAIRTLKINAASRMGFASDKVFLRFRPDS